MANTWGGSREGSGRKAKIDGAQERKRNGTIYNHFEKKTAKKPPVTTVTQAKQSTTSLKLLQKSTQGLKGNSSEKWATIFDKQKLNKSTNTNKKDDVGVINRKLGKNPELNEYNKETTIMNKKSVSKQSQNHITRDNKKEINLQETKRIEELANKYRDRMSQNLYHKKNYESKNQMLDGLDSEEDFDDLIFNEEEKQHTTIRISSPYAPSENSLRGSYLDLMKKKIIVKTGINAEKQWYAPDNNPLSKSVPHMNNYTKSNTWIYYFNPLAQYTNMIGKSDYKTYKCIECNKKDTLQSNGWHSRPMIDFNRKKSWCYISA